MLPTKTDSFKNLQTKLKHFVHKYFDFKLLLNAMWTKDMCVEKEITICVQLVEYEKMA